MHFYPTQNLPPCSPVGRRARRCRASSWARVQPRGLPRAAAAQSAPGCPPRSSTDSSADLSSGERQMQLTKECRQRHWEARSVRCAALLHAERAAQAQSSLAARAVEGAALGDGPQCVGWRSAGAGVVGSAQLGLGGRAAAGAAGTCWQAALSCRTARWCASGSAACSAGCCGSAAGGRLYRSIVLPRLQQGLQRGCSWRGCTGEGRAPLCAEGQQGEREA